MSLLPAIRGQDDLDRRHDDASLWRPALEAIADRHDLAGELRPEPDGSTVVFGLGDHLIVKLHAPWTPDCFATEAFCLAALHDRLPVDSPKLIATGNLEGWSYLVMTRLGGQPLNRVRDTVGRADLLAIARDAGRLARAIQSLPTTGFEPFKAWPTFLADQRRGLLDHHGGYELAEHLLTSLPAAIDGAELETDRPVLLHTEITDTNIMVDETAEGWRLSGVFDFEPAMVGHPLYDLPAITIFVCRGDPELCTAALDGFEVDKSERLRQHLLACNALHRYSRFDFFLELVGVETPPPDWHTAAHHLFGF